MQNEKNKSVILAVDDQKKNIELLEAFLLPTGYELISASNGEDALEKLSKNKIDLILLDVMMPGMNGFEVARRVRQNPEHRRLPIILLTALREMEDRVKGIEAGCDDFISKPFNKIELIARVKSLLKVKAYNDLMTNYRKELEFEVNARTEELKKMMDSLIETNAAIRRFVPEQFLEQLGKSSIENVKLGDHIAINMVVMFADIRDFSTLSESMTPEETFSFINQYLSKLGPSVRKHGGFIDKYIGDGIMALFPTSPENALRCAIEMNERLFEFNIQRAKEGHPYIKIGIGIHEGNLMLGTIGENERMDSTVISDTVNTTSRIESISKQFGIGIAVSELVILGLEDPSMYHIRFLGKINVKGRSAAVSIFEIYDADPEPLIILKDSIKGRYERGLNSYHSKKYENALEFFNGVLSELPDDKASLHYIHLIKEILKGENINVDNGMVLAGTGKFS